MRCSNCGKEIPMAGKVCPWCKIDKTPDVLRETWLKLGAIGGGIAGMFLFGIWEQWLWGVFWGAIAGGIVGGIHGNNLAEKYKRDQHAMQTMFENQRVADHATIAHNAISGNGGAVQQSSSPVQHNGGAFPPPLVHPVPPPVNAFYADPQDREPTTYVSAAQREEAEMLASGQYKKCYHCAELIKSEARVCRFCNRDIALPVGANR